MSGALAVVSDPEGRTRATCLPIHGDLSPAELCRLARPNAEDLAVLRDRPRAGQPPRLDGDAGRRRAAWC